MPPDAEQVSATVFAALADPNRRALLTSLAEIGPSTATELGRRLGITRQGVTKHLEVLEETGLVIAKSGSGRRVLYQHRTAPLKIAQSYLAALAADWDGPLERLTNFLEEQP
jgi:DNA-binding transcriptional ArsR family regulator